MDPGLLDAIERGDATAAAALFLNNPAMDPAADNSVAIVWAAMHGDADLVALLLADPRVDPATRGDAAIVWAASRGPPPGGPPREPRWHDGWGS